MDKLDHSTSLLSSQSFIRITISPAMSLTQTNHEINNDNNEHTNISNWKPRGQPPGSKNKPKPLLIIIDHEITIDSAMHTIFLQILDSTDILDAVFSFSCSYHIGVSVIRATGAIYGLSLCRPSAVALSGARFEILSLSGTFLPSSTGSGSTSFVISVVGLDGGVIGGVVKGGLMAVGEVVLTASKFTKAEFYKIPLEVEVENGEQIRQVGFSRELTSQQMILAIRFPPPHSHRWSIPPPPPPHY